MISIAQTVFTNSAEYKIVYFSAILFTWVSLKDACPNFQIDFVTKSWPGLLKSQARLVSMGSSFRSDLRDLYM